MELQNILELDLGLQPGTSKGQTVFYDLNFQNLFLNIEKSEQYLFVVRQGMELDTESLKKYLLSLGYSNGNTILLNKQI